MSVPAAHFLRLACLWRVRLLVTCVWWCAAFRLTRQADETAGSRGRKCRAKESREQREAQGIRQEAAAASSLCVERLLQQARRTCGWPAWRAAFRACARKFYRVELTTASAMFSFGAPVASAESAAVDVPGPGTGESVTVSGLSFGMTAPSGMVQFAGVMSSETTWSSTSSLTCATSASPAAGMITISAVVATFPTV